ncbi:MAG: tRNA guanosine(34) transglycosylase Tgt, partial [Acetobacter fabarum]|nr:tRNA guanosine(34) transglycosylase Tgt [Acetobacter fabarum]
YLHHLFRANEILGPMLLTWHNIAYYQRLMRQIRQAIMDKNLEATAARMRSEWAAQDWTEDEMPQPRIPPIP